jgi:Flp pilus assembly protein TadB
MRRQTRSTSDSSARPPSSRTTADARSLVATSALAFLAAFVVWAATYPAVAAAAAAGALLAPAIVALARRASRRSRGFGSADGVRA